MERLNRMIAAVCEKPALYVGRADMRLVRAFWDGYICALAVSREWDAYSFGGFLRWLEVQYNICNVGWGWDSILAHAAGSHEAAIRSLPDRFSQYCEAVASGAFDTDTARERHFGGESREPDETYTKGWHDHF
jgi:hypothetical protein